MVETWTSLVVQWSKLCLPMQGPWVRSLVWEDSTCRGVTKPCVPQLLNRCSKAWEPQLLKPVSPRACAQQHKKPLKRET